jgi:hypothetical protein
MVKNALVHDRAALTPLARLLRERSHLIAFQYDSGFTVRFRHEIPRAHPALPVQISLVLRVPWWPGNASDIPPNLSVADAARIHCSPEQPYQAFTLMTLIGWRVEHVEIAPYRSMTIRFSVRADLSPSFNCSKLMAPESHSATFSRALRKRNQHTIFQRNQLKTPTPSATSQASFTCLAWPAESTMK